MPAPLAISTGVQVIPIGIYVRISDADKDESGEVSREGVTRQEKDCRKLADDLSDSMGLGLDVVRLYDDNDLTAADERIRRPDFEAMLVDLEAGVIQGFIFYHADRVARLELDAARVTRIFRLNPRYLGRSVMGGTDLSTDEGRAMFVVQAVMGGMEVSATRRRVTRRNQDAAAAGRDHGGKRPFGWEDDRKTLRESEAELVRQAIRDIPKGKTIGTIRGEWIQAGVVATAEGKGPLRDRAVLMRIVSPRVCGYRIYSSAQDRREAGGNIWPPDHVLYVNDEPVIGEWTPIVTPDEWKACVATLEGRRTQRTVEHDFSRLHAKYFLSGIARCGECGGKLYGHISTGDTKHRYLCSKREGGCGGVKRVGPPLDDLVESLFLEATQAALGEVEADIDDTVYDTQLAQLRQDKRDVMARRKAGHPQRISTATAMELIADIEAEILDLTYKARTLTAKKARNQTDAPALLAEWTGYTMDMRRERLRRDVSAVVVNKTRRGARFDPACVELIWA